jgi:hypothetical protein
MYFEHMHSYNVWAEPKPPLTAFGIGGFLSSSLSAWYRGTRSRLHIIVTTF